MTFSNSFLNASLIGNALPRAPPVCSNGSTGCCGIYFVPLALFILYPAYLLLSLTSSIHTASFEFQLKRIHYANDHDLFQIKPFSTIKIVMKKGFGRKNHARRRTSSAPN
jgi:hypothetical protein